jgi:hypothetical protein
MDPLAPRRVPLTSRFVGRKGNEPVRFHVPSYLLGVASATTVMALPKRFRPVLVEAAALGQVVIRTGRTLIERQREAVDDLWAEITERATQRMKRGSTNGQRSVSVSAPQEDDARI